jgi:arylsulfatase A-like enzyme
VPWIQDYFTERLRTLQDVDDAVERLIATLEETGELENTYVFFVSDNGHLLGEHRLVQKNVLYREALAIPLVVRVPGATPSTSSRPVTIVDLAPTIAELAGVEPQRVVDGRSFVPLLRGQPLRWRDTQLVLTGGTRTVGPLPGWEYRGVRTHRYTFMRRAVDGVEFLFDRRRHPEENVNVASARRYRAVRLELRERLQALAVCSAEDCWRRFGRMPPLPPAR